MTAVPTISSLFRGVVVPIPTYPLRSRFRFITLADPASTALPIWNTPVPILELYLIKKLCAPAASDWSAKVSCGTDAADMVRPFPTGVDVPIPQFPNRSITEVSVPPVLYMSKIFAV